MLLCTKSSAHIIYGGNFVSKFFHQNVITCSSCWHRLGCAGCWVLHWFCEMPSFKWVKSSFKSFFASLNIQFYSEIGTLCKMDCKCYFMIVSWNWGQFKGIVHPKMNMATLTFTYRSAFWNVLFTQQLAVEDGVLSLWMCNWRQACILFVTITCHHCPCPKITPSITAKSYHTSHDKSSTEAQFHPFNLN